MWDKLEDGTLVSRIKARIVVKYLIYKYLNLL